MDNHPQNQLRQETIELKSGDGHVRASAMVLPGLGANLVSFQVDGVDLIYWNERAFLDEGTFSGGFNMFPTPCRLAGCAYSFEGRHIVQKKHGKEIFLHGLLRDEPMESRNSGNSVTSIVEIKPSHPMFEGFPFKCRLFITHALGFSESSCNESCEDRPALTISFLLENRDSVNIPFGFGIHPYWHIHGARDDMRIRIPCDNVMAQENLIPTGECSPVNGTAFDLRSFRSLADLDLDNIFLVRREKDTAAIEFGALRRQIVVSASSEFTHMIAYTPPGKPYFCFENLTSSPNAPNLAKAGHGERAHMLVIPPGRQAEGWVRYSVEAI